MDLRRRVVAFRLLAVKPGRDIGQVFKIQVQRSYVMCKSVGIVFPKLEFTFTQGIFPCLDF